MPADPSGPHRPPLLTRPLLLYFFAAFGAMTAFYLLLSVVPLYATTMGSGRAGAGLTTGALMFATVAAELVSPALIVRWGYRAVLGTGLVLLGLPALGLIGQTSLSVILAVSVVRGIGLATFVVAGSALVALLVPRERRAEGLGVSGIAVGVPAVVALPLGVWLAERVGYPPVFAAAAAAALAGLMALPAMPGRQSAGTRMIGVLAGLRSSAQTRPALVFLMTAVSAGVVVTFLPLATRGSPRLAVAALLAHSVTTTAARWWAGRYGDRLGQPRVLCWGTLVAGVGMLALVLVEQSGAVAAGAVLLGTGFGVAQNASLAIMFDQVTEAGYDMVSAVWNLAYDLGLGLGAAAFGLLVVPAGYSAAFGITGALMLAVLLPAWRNRGWLTPAAGVHRGVPTASETGGEPGPGGLSSG